MRQKVERLFERFLWGSRFAVLAAVLSSLASSFAMFFVATVDAWYMLVHLVDYARHDMSLEQRALHRADTIKHVVEIVDGYLLATILLIFALGLYELFISDIDEAKGSETASNVLLIENLDDLKTRLAKVILMILIVKFFEHAIGMRFDHPAELLHLAGGIALIGLALFLSHHGTTHLPHGGDPPSVQG